MKLFRKFLRYYIIYSICELLIILMDQSFIFNQYFLLGVVYVFLFLSPLNSLFILLIHCVKLNNRILGNLFNEVIASLLPSLIIWIFSSVLSMYKKYNIDDVYIWIISYCFFLVILVVHGRICEK